MAPMMDSTEPKAELKKHYKSAQMQKTHAELKEKAASGDEAALDDETASDDKATSDKSELYGIWIAWCQAQQKYGFAILHRIKALQALSSNTNTSTSTTIDERISHLKILYHKHLEALQRSWAEWTAQPTGGRAGDHDESELPRITYEIRQPLAWEEHQKTCHHIPAIGLGTWQSKPNEVKEAVCAALKAEYRHIDAAAVYGNEKKITSKLWNTRHEPEHVEEALEQTLRDLQVDYLDLYLIHWPVAFRYSTTTTQPVDAETGLVDVIDVPIKDTWAAMEKLVEKGKVRSIGVSNFTRKRIEELMTTARIPPAVNQIEAHPYLQQRELLEWSKQQGIVITAYSPLGNNIYSMPRAVDDPTVIQIAKELGKTPAQVLISWAIQRGTSVVPKSVTPERIRSNLEVFVLPDDAFERIQALDRHQRMNFPARLGVDIFGEVGEESVRQSALEWARQQKMLANGQK
ncbi:hypothetical protein CNMCM6106_006242 [Aspergillus hiratsukae]|uniref:D-xylose reductase [NAD(P)H] n=1 Tax=Aspergillus hiratsukae TaxID=1194566 RepID=A0A8H6QFT6_9EURO|nr:hypothetical protein CNMCM6106_006242 [Aspergillus hiratsukae]